MKMMERGELDSSSPVSAVDHGSEKDGEARVDNRRPGVEKRSKPPLLASEVSSSWAGVAWFDPNDPRLVLSGPDSKGY